MAFPIPAATSFPDFSLYAQAAALDLATSAVSASNGWAIGIGS